MDRYTAAVPSIGENILNARRAAGFGGKDQGRFAKHIGVAQSRLSDWENNRFKEIELSSLIKIAKGANVTVEQLIAGFDPEYDQIRHTVARESAHGDEMSLKISQQLHKDVDVRPISAEIHPSQGKNGAHRDVPATDHLSAALIARLDRIDHAIETLGDLSQSVRDLESVSSGIADRIAGFAALAEIREQVTTARALQAPKPTDSRKHRRSDADKNRRRRGR